VVPGSNEKEKKESFLEKQKKTDQQKKVLVTSSVFSIKKKSSGGKFRLCPNYQNIKMNRTCGRAAFFFVTAANELFNPDLAMFHVATRNGTNSKKEKNERSR